MPKRRMILPCLIILPFIVSDQTQIDSLSSIQSKSVTISPIATASGDKKFKD